MWPSGDSTTNDDRKTSVLEPGEVIYGKCHQCSFHYTQPEQLVKHSASHSHIQHTESKFQCTGCPYASDELWRFAEHVSFHIGDHAPVIYTCQKCSEATTNILLMDGHMIKDHPALIPCEQKYDATQVKAAPPHWSCALCKDRYFSMKMYLILHLAKTHKLNASQVKEIQKLNAPSVAYERQTRNRSTEDRTTERKISEMSEHVATMKPEQANQDSANFHLDCPQFPKSEPLSVKGEKGTLDILQGDFDCPQFPKSEPLSVKEEKGTLDIPQGDPDCPQFPKSETLSVKEEKGTLDIPQGNPNCPQFPKSEPLSVKEEKGTLDIPQGDLDCPQFPKSEPLSVKEEKGTLDIPQGDHNLQRITSADTPLGDKDAKIIEGPKWRQNIKQERSVSENASPKVEVSSELDTTRQINYDVTDNASGVSGTCEFQCDTSTEPDCDPASVSMKNTWEGPQCDLEQADFQGLVPARPCISVAEALPASVQEITNMQPVEDPKNRHFETPCVAGYDVDRCSPILIQGTGTQESIASYHVNAKSGMYTAGHICQTDNDQMRVNKKAISVPAFEIVSYEPKLQDTTTDRYAQHHTFDTPVLNQNVELHTIGQRAIFMCKVCKFQSQFSHSMKQHILALHSPPLPQSLEGIADVSSPRKDSGCSLEYTQPTDSDIPLEVNIKVHSNPTEAGLSKLNLPAPQSVESNEPQCQGTLSDVSKCAESGPNRLNIKMHSNPTEVESSKLNRPDSSSLPQTVESNEPLCKSNLSDVSRCAKSGSNKIQHKLDHSSKISSSRISERYQNKSQATLPEPNGLKIYKCFLCNKYHTDSRSSIEEHLMGRELGYKPYHCTQCPTQCSSSRKVSRHYDMMHDKKSAKQKVKYVPDKQTELQITEIMRKCVAYIDIKKIPISEIQDRDGNYVYPSKRSMVNETIFSKQSRMTHGGGDREHASNADGASGCGDLPRVSLSNLPSHAACKAIDQHEDQQITKIWESLNFTRLHMSGMSESNRKRKPGYDQEGTKTANPKQTRQRNCKLPPERTYDVTKLHMPSVKNCNQSKADINRGKASKSALKKQREPLLLAVRQNYQCPNCSYQAKTRKSMKRHFLHELSCKMYECKTCTYKSVRRNSLLEHCKRKHRYTLPRCADMYSEIPLSAEQRGNLRNMVAGSIIKQKPAKGEVCKPLTPHDHVEETPRRTARSYSTLQENNSQTVDKVAKLPETTYKCPYCDFQTNLYGNIKAHVYKEIGFKPYICSLCQFSAPLESEVVAHVDLVHPEVDLRESKKTVRYQMEEEEEEILNRVIDACRRLQQQTDSQLHGQVYPTVRQTRQATLCKRTEHATQTQIGCTFDEHVSKHYTKTAASSKRHQHRHRSKVVDNAGKTYVCVICQYQFASISKLEEHMRRELEYKPYKCTACSYQSVVEFSVRRHFKTHQGLRYKCLFIQDHKKEVKVRKLVKRSEVNKKGLKNRNVKNC